MQLPAWLDRNQLLYKATWLFDFYGATMERKDSGFRGSHHQHSEKPTNLIITDWLKIWEKKLNK